MNGNFHSRGVGLGVVVKTGVIYLSYNWSEMIQNPLPRNAKKIFINPFKQGKGGDQGKEWKLFIFNLFYFDGFPEAGVTLRHEAPERDEGVQGEHRPGQHGLHCLQARHGQTDGEPHSLTVFTISLSSVSVIRTFQTFSTNTADTVNSLYPYLIFKQVHDRGTMNTFSKPVFISLFLDAVTTLL